ncbi:MULTISPECIES: SDR family NAD(P)-dependent oxidoreductase [unclassified Mycolicibacterium]|uniref:SDR family NAD(P)-dependent oxidoreductase n=1 Tax=unclassified Mycolicibacterium TaxID=2636767 RepID=UPI002ED8D6CA
MNGDTHVIITGAASGIGRATALLCAEQGLRLTLIDLYREAVEPVAHEARSRGAADVLSINCDVSVEEQVHESITAGAQRLGPPTGLVASAGIEINGQAHQLNLVDWQRTVDVNLTGAFLCCKYTLAEMLSAGNENAGAGRSIVLVSSPAALVGFAGGGNAAYAASKGGVSAMTRSMALDYARYGIRINAVVPGSTDTDLLYTGVAAADLADKRRAIETAAREQIPLQRLADPREIAQAIDWLLSPQSSYVTGSHLVCDGGLMAKSANTF